MVFPSTIAESADQRVSTSALSPVTVIVSAAVPSFRTRLRAACWATSSPMPVCTPVLNPCRLARVSYLPGGRPGTVKYPFASVATFRVRPVSRFLTTTSTPGRTPPVSSLMVPEMVADVICATATDVVAARRTTARVTLHLMTTSLSSNETGAHEWRGYPGFGVFRPGYGCRRLSTGELRKLLVDVTPGFPFLNPKTEPAGSPSRQIQSHERT